MSTDTFAEIDELNQSDGATSAIDKLIETLREQKEFHKLFDATMMKKKFEMGVPVTRPTSFDDVPEEKRDQFEQDYIDSARQVGELFLSDGKIGDAWLYFRTIRESEPVKQAIEAMDSRRDADEETEQIINIALYEGAHPIKGLEMMLRTHGTCNTITALDQQLPQMSPENRNQSASLLVRELYQDLCGTLRHEVEQRLAMVPPGESLRELIAGRDWLFEEGNYHIDVSHLSSVVRFARSMDASCPELTKAIELTEYGTRLDQQFQYPGDPPFDDFYAAHKQFFSALVGQNQDEAIAYFQQKLDKEPEEPDKQLIAYVMVDLLTRIGRLDESLELAATYLKDIDDAEGFSFVELCQQAGRMDTLQQVSREKGDLVSYTAALIQAETSAVSQQ